MSRVYVVQNSQRYDNDTGTYVPVHDVSPAKEYGELRYLLSPAAGPWNVESILDDLWKGLEDFGPDDYLLMIGNPVLCGLAAIVAAEVNDGRLQFLQWNGSRRKYLSVAAQVYEVEAASERG